MGIESEQEKSGQIWPHRFADRTVLITGAGGGLGATAAARLRAEGATVISTDVVAPAPAESGESAESGQPAGLELELDVTDPQAWQRTVDAVLSHYGRLDGALFCHGIQGPEYPVEQVPIDGWQRTLEVNLNGSFYGLRSIISAMTRAGYGRVVMLSSIAGREGNQNMSAYSVSKAGMITLAKSVAKETARHGITINCVAPSMFNTRLLQDLSAERNAALLSRVPMGRVGEPEEFASLAAWLLSTESSYMTGQVLDLSGGRNTS